MAQSQSNIVRWPSGEDPRPPQDRPKQLGGEDQVPSVEIDYELDSRLKDWFGEARDQLYEWRTMATEDFDFAAGWQWDEQDQQLLREQNRPAVTYNRIGRNVDAVSGIESDNQQELTYLPRELGDVQGNEVLTAGANWIWDETDTIDEKSDAFRDLLICGMGWTNLEMNWLDWPEGMAEEKRIDPLRMYWDPYASRRNLKDGRFLAYAMAMPMVEARALVPGAYDWELNAGWAQVFDDPALGNVPDRQSYSYEQWGSHSYNLMDRVTMVELQWWEKIPATLVWDLKKGPMARPVRMAPDRAQWVATGDPERYKIIPTQMKEYHRAIIGAHVLKRQKLEAQKDFTYHCMTGKRDQTHGYWRGIVAAMKDPQRWSNKFFSTSMDIVARNGKGGAIVEVDAMTDPAKFERDWNKSGAITVVEPGALANGKLQEKQAGAFPPQLDKLLEFSVESIQATSGISLETLGQTNRDQSGVLEYERKKAGMSILADMFKAKKLHTVRTGRLLLAYMRNFMNDGRLVRIQSEGMARFVPLALDPAFQNFDVVVDESPSSPNQKERTWAILERNMPLMANMGLPQEAWGAIMEYSPLPSGLVGKIMKSLQQSGEPTPEQKQQMELMMRQVMAQIQKDEASAAKDMAGAQQAQSTAQLNQAKIEDVITQALLNMAKEEIEIELGELFNDQVGERLTFGVGNLEQGEVVGLSLRSGMHSTELPTEPHAVQASA